MLHTASTQSVSQSVRQLLHAAATTAAATATSDVTASTCIACCTLRRSASHVRSGVERRSAMEHYLTVTTDRHGRGRTTSASSSVLSTLSRPSADDEEDNGVLPLPLSRSRHSVDCSGFLSSSAQRQTSATTSRSTSRLHLGVPQSNYVPVARPGGTTSLVARPDFISEFLRATTSMQHVQGASRPSQHVQTSPRSSSRQLRPRSTSRLHLGVPGEMRRQSLQTVDHRHRPPRPRRSPEDRRTEYAHASCDGGAGCAHSSGSRSSVALTDDEVNSVRRVSCSSGAPLRSVAAVSATRDTTIFDIGADLIKVSPPLSTYLLTTCLKRPPFDGHARAAEGFFLNLGFYF